MKKTEVHVPIANKKEAKQAKNILKVLGENFAKHNFYDGQEDSLWLFDDNYWTTCLNKVTDCCKGRKQITLKQLIELLVKEQPSDKIAVRVENEKEFNALMKYYDSLGYKTITEIYNSIFTIINDRVAWVSGGLEDNSYTHVNFSDFAKDKGIKLPLIKSEDGVWLYEGDKLFEVNKKCNSETWYLVNADNGKGFWIVGKEASKWNLSESYGYCSKAFSTKQSALDWIEAQKPKDIIINSNSSYPIIVYAKPFLGNEYIHLDMSKRGDYNGANLCFSIQELRETVKAYELLHEKS